jgi:hypothetical protein
MIYAAPHPAFPEPEDKETLLWRYQDFAKFEWLAKEKRLFMPNAANLGEPLEGTQPPGYDDWWTSTAEAATTALERETIEHNRDLLVRFAAAFRTRYYVSCWHMNPAENHEMWGNYTTSSKSVAISTTYKKLRSCIQPYVGMGMVRYIDYSIDRLPTLNMFEYITHKNKHFEYERELRAVAMHPVIEGLDRIHFQESHFQSENSSTFLVYAPPVDLSFIESVILHPNATHEFSAKVASLCNESGLPAPQKSTIQSGDL